MFIGDWARIIFVIVPIASRCQGMQDDFDVHRADASRKHAGVSYLRIGLTCDRCPLALSFVNA